jgi:hypothetical protein
MPRHFGVCERVPVHPFSTLCSNACDEPLLVRWLTARFVRTLRRRCCADAVAVCWSGAALVLGLIIP